MTFVDGTFDAACLALGQDVFRCAQRVFHFLNTGRSSLHEGTEVGQFLVDLLLAEIQFVKRCVFRFAGSHELAEDEVYKPGDQEEEGERKVEGDAVHEVLPKLFTGEG